MQLVIACLKYWLWQIATKVVLGVIYIAVISEGLRYLIPGMGQKLWKIPFLHWLRDYEATYKLDLAPFMAIFILLAVWWCWARVIEIWLGWDAGFDTTGWDLTNYRLMMQVIAGVLIIADACLFYLSMTQVGWGGSGFSFSAGLATATYVAVLIFVCFVSICLRKTITELKKEYFHEVLPPPVVHPVTRKPDRMREAPRVSEPVSANGR